MHKIREIVDEVLERARARAARREAPRRRRVIQLSEGRELDERDVARWIFDPDLG